MPFEHFSPEKQEEFSAIEVTPDDRDKAVAFFDEATKEEPDNKVLSEIIDNHSKPKKLMEALAVVTLDKTDPKSDARWGKIRAALKKYDKANITGYLKIFNDAAREEALRRGRRG